MWWCKGSGDPLDSYRTTMRVPGRIPLLAFLAAAVPYAWPAPAPGGQCIVINEIYYDHPGGDDGWEFIELYNAGDATADLSGTRLECIDGRTGAARTVWEARPGQAAAPGAYLLVAGANWRSHADDSLTGQLENGPDAVRLVSHEGPLDLVGYGESLPPSLYEGAPAPDVNPGFSLARSPDGRDTQFNDADFAVSTPSPGMRNVYGRNLRLLVEREGVLPCTGAALRLSVTIGNTGLENFSGWAALHCTIAVAGDRYDGGRLERRLDIERGMADSILFVVSPPPAAMMDVETVLSAEGDQCPLDDTSRTVVRTSPGTVVVNEIMYRPAIGGSEWVEILNTGDERCNIGGWTFSDAASPPRLVTDGECWIERGEFLVLAQYPERIRGAAPEGAVRVVGIEGGWPALNDRDGDRWADEVCLYDRSGVLVEQAGYRDLLGEERGRSIERISEHLCSAEPGGLWHRCALPGGSTPGVENSVHFTGVYSSEGIRVEPNPFCASLHGTTAISGSCLTDERGFSIRIFDLDGFERRRLYGEEGGARLFTCRWDGRDAQNVPVATGLYICLVEFVGCGGGVCRRERTCIAVFGGY